MAKCNADGGKTVDKSEHHKRYLNDSGRGSSLRNCGAVVAFQFSEDDGGQDSQCTEDTECLVDAMDHVSGIGAKSVGNEESSDERC